MSGAAHTYRFSANTGFLWPDHPFLERIEQAAAHGFAGVEFHDEAQGTDRAALRATLAATGMPVFSLNTRKGDGFGYAALPGEGDRARAEVDAALEVATDIDAACVHVLAGLASGDAARAAYVDTLGYALEAADRVILIEPLSHVAAPGYFLRTVDQAAEIVAELDHPRLKIMFDCYHVHHESGDVPGRFRAHADKIGHVQIASAETRAEPLGGALDYAALLPGFRAAGYDGAFGCEYRPAGATEAGLGWRDAIA